MQRPLTTNVDRLNRAWSTPSGWAGRLSAVNHRTIGTRFVVLAFVFFLLGGLQASAMRLQLAQPDLTVLPPETYNQFFTMHGTTMMFLFAVPILEGLMIYIVPLMIGARDMAFPRLNAFGFWLFVFAGGLLYLSLLSGHAADVGWFNYVPLSGPGFSPGPGVDFWLIGVTLLEVSALVAAVEFIVTIVKFRAPGMSLNRLPIFGWASLVTSWMIVVAMPAVMVVSIFLELDRKLDTNFFNVAAGGDVFLWQHLFWFFGHPDVYILLLPAFGIISTVIPTAVRTPIASYTAVVAAIVAIGFLSFGLWVHHMYASGLALLGLNFFAAASMMITIPSGVQVFAWIATIWRGALSVNTVFLFAVGTIVVFILGGFTGVMVASPPFDWQVTDSYFVVAHFHYVLIGGVVLPIFGGLYYWLPKMTGRLLDESAGRWSFWLLFIGFNVTFFPQHLLGLLGMPRRVYTYLPGLGWDGLNLLATIGAFVAGLGVLVFLVNVFASLSIGERAGNNPWSAGTLEWATSSPPPQYNFEWIPVVSSRFPLWQQERLEPPHEQPPVGWRDFADTPYLDRETYVTTALDGEAEAKALLPGPSTLPLWLALGVTIIFLGFLTELILLPIGVLMSYLVLVVWTWPKDGSTTRPELPVASRDGTLPSVVSGPRSTLWWGVLLLIIIEATAFGMLLFSYFYLGLDTQQWPPAGAALSPELAGVGVVAVVLSVAAVHWSERQLHRGDQRGFRLSLIASLGLVALAAILGAVDLARWPFRWSSSAYASIVWVMNGTYLLHLLVLLLVGVPLAILARRGYFRSERFAAIESLALYWYFVVAVGVVVFATVYLVPHLL